MVAQKSLFGVHSSVPPNMILGTAQLGMSYGVSNHTGQPSLPEACSMVRFALDSGYSWFDTAQAYGNSETVLGECFGSYSSKVKIITKLHPKLRPHDKLGIKKSLMDSCQRLRVLSLQGVLLHRSSWLEHWNDGLGEALLEAKKEGLVSHLGVSIYDAAELAYIAARPEITMVQCPFNVWDPQFLQTDLFHNPNMLVMVRSIYLQGLLLMSPEQVKQRVPSAYGMSLAWHALCASWSLSPVEVALRYVASFSLPMVIGVETRWQLQDNVSLLAKPPLSAHMVRDIQDQLHPFAKKDFVNPVNWP